MRLEYHNPSADVRVSAWAVCTGTAGVGCLLTTVGSVLMVVLRGPLKYNPYNLWSDLVLDRKPTDAGFCWFVGGLLLTGVLLLLVGNPRFWCEWSRELLRKRREARAAQGRGSSAWAVAWYFIGYLFALAAVACGALMFVPAAWGGGLPVEDPLAVAEAAIVASLALFIMGYLSDRFSPPRTPRPVGSRLNTAHAALSK